MAKRRNINIAPFQLVFYIVIALALPFFVWVAYQRTQIRSNAQLTTTQPFNNMARLSGTGCFETTNPGFVIDFSRQNTGRSFSIDGWIKRDTGATQTILSFEHSDTNVPAYNLSLINGKLTFAVNSEVKGSTTDKETGTIQSTTVLPKTGAFGAKIWSHFYVQRAGSTLRMFIDGKEDAAPVTMAVTPGKTIMAATLTIGCESLYNTTQQYKNYFVGSIEELQISQKARIDYYKTSFETPLAPLLRDQYTLALWHMDETTGPYTKIINSAGNNLYHGDLKGSANFIKNDMPLTPVVRTPKLDTALQYSAYSSSIFGELSFPSIYLTMTIAGLPAGMTSGPCQQTWTGIFTPVDYASPIWCTISGTPTVSGVFPLTVEVRDLYGNKGTKVINLTVQEVILPTPTPTLTPTPTPTATPTPTPTRGRPGVLCQKSKVKCLNGGSQVMINGKCACPPTTNTQ